MADTLILVDPQDREIGSADKLYAHQQGLLHRAFSIFIFDSNARLLLQQRALGKYHSQGLWTNTCCGHPRPGERTRAAANRRLREEMGLRCTLTPVSTLLYHEQVSNQLIEHEYDHVYAGISRTAPIANPEEAHAWRWQNVSGLGPLIAANPDAFSVWFVQIFQHVGPSGLRHWKTLAQRHG
ncbi:isopentenyl-diphosphate delta-isomerase [Pseudomonas sp. ok272]|uniref:isopentenyl-diphosphate Delta-isomerase n=1 Tax=unclassified Pseudomonas TaxID=196821 RepID=UPI0008CF0C2F|nr:MULTISPECIES: isopentenyl-diphosphate Delta-isomerase [unclassified Pseudomonas]SEN53853.1 isopentenyl-diphosphate delta-isomerase [Pseudomonas sp. ok272]SFN35295.1 isopentenyl-diphosphate delta-isomerase [Pseudomonas sp. ok602]